ncbi:MAG: hypothetical protein AWM53_00804 [Candidatus Dichloromethanomonas elyunquensis]|nr:MAG: hypothetical protein AWM53_00804 [Candidatus Dichloromethanomonas elyunquensis]
MSEFHAAAWMVPLDSGLNKKHIIKVLTLLPEDCELVPFEIHESNSSAYGFATTEVIDEENGLESIIDLLSPVVDDWTNESSNCTYALPGGKKVYIGCDFRTVIIGGGDEKK